MTKVIASKRVTVDRVMKYSGRQETWDFLVGETEVPEEVADELVPQFAGLKIADPEPEDGGTSEAGAGGYANRMMTTDSAEMCGEPTITGGPCKNKKPCWRHKKIKIPGRG